MTHPAPTWSGSSAPASARPSPRRCTWPRPSAQGLDYVYRTIDLNAIGVAPERIGEVLDWARALGFDALNVTHPCKRLVIEHLDDVDDVAAALGAVNTVVFDGSRAVGYNTDTTGFAHGFAEGLPGAATDNVVLIGAGGAGAAVGDALLRLGADHLTIVDVDVERATALADELSAAAAGGPGRRVVARQAGRAAARTATASCTARRPAWPTTPALPFDPELLHPGLWVADIVYRPLDTALLGAAPRAGCRTSATAATWPCTRPPRPSHLITGITPDAERMSRHFRRLVG